MAPSSMAQPKPARSASGHTKKQHAAPIPTPPVVAPASRQQVIPAIPLAYMNKQFNGTRNAAAGSSAKRALAASASSNGFPASSLEAALISHDPLPSTENSENEAKSQHVEEDPAAAFSSGLKLQSQSSSVQVNSVSHTSTESNTSAGYGAEHTPDANGVPSHASQPQSATSTTKPEFAPAFPATSHPLQHPQHPADQHHHPVFHAPSHHMHQHSHQISNGGGIMFGGFESHTPSPAPLPGGFMPPPHHINSDNRGHPPPSSHHHAHSNGNGFPTPINTHFQEVMPMPNMNGYGGRAMPAPTPPGPFEPMGPGAGRYGPPTPHSFHGSHTSGEPNGVENITLPYLPNGSFPPHAHREHPAAHPPPLGLFPPFVPPPTVSRPFNLAEDDVMEGVRYIRSLFDNEELSDCVLELVFAKDPQHPQQPVKISGHKLILARSPALKQHILGARAKDRGSQTITVEPDDSYLRQDAWWMAVQRLYQHPLFQVPSMFGNGANGIDFAGNQGDRFGFCLGYAAAGHLLALQDVLIRGLEIAANHLTWETVEVGLGFVLENTIHRHFDHGAEPEEALPPTFLEFGYGPETKILLSAILHFLIAEFPPNFELDVSVLDPPKIARIPMSTGTTAASTATTSRARTTDRVVPAIARGSIARHPPKQTRLSSIKFGDLPASFPEDGMLLREPAKCSPILSRILLNLPFDELCQVLTSGSNAVSDWNTAQDRYHAVVEVVAEREVRRLRAVDAVRSEAIPNAREIQSRLSTPHRHTTAEPWDVLNWKEEVIRDETPRIVRRWVPQFDVAQQPAQQRSPSPYDMPDSIV